MSIWNKIGAGAIKKLKKYKTPPLDIGGKK